MIVLRGTKGRMLEFRVQFDIEKCDAVNVYCKAVTFFRLSRHDGLHSHVPYTGYAPAHF